MMGVQRILDKLGTSDFSFSEDKKLSDVHEGNVFFIDGGDEFRWFKSQGEFFVFWINVISLSHLDQPLRISSSNGAARAAEGAGEIEVARVTIHSAKERNELVDGLLKDRFILNEEEKQLIINAAQMELL
jgi:hypothetical protein